MTFGPIQLIVIGFEDNENFQGDVLRELDALHSRGVTRLLDLLFVMKSESGEVVAMETSDLTADEQEELGALIGGLIGLGAGGTESAAVGAEFGALAAAEKSFGISAVDVQNLADTIEPGTSAAMLMIEHTWAAGLKAAIRNAGGHPLMEGFLTPEALLMVGKELEAIVEAEAAIELADAIEGAAMLKALTAVAEAELIEEAAIEEAAQVVLEAEAIKTAAAADAARALIVAGLIEEAAAQEAIDTLVVAGLIEEAAIDHAAKVVAESQAMVEEALADNE